ncbi:MAG: hypothetical protein HN336_06350 [Lentimicrobiaceae bacterium]|jgi:hypothetical protein|nr:hypothetical protein [Lentimicrobiaceae bacterium]MCP4910411.1 hypothetical protein [Bacteroidota bacterium]MBT3455152.1 hypothetical protein [Lentimicrobiaceae bacterium]MBT3819380.1 hypothetical protein [Lentimicrobiaceae bacterium]MBT4191654.1 hypothetical protein [Lentimicrobiaceae bacterium]
MKKYTLLFLIVLSSISMSAQFGEVLRFNSGGMLSIQWNVSTPIGELKNLTDKTTLNGISIDYRHCYKRNIIIGGRTGWQKFFEDKGITNLENNSTSTYVNVENKVSIAPILIVMDYMIPSEKFIPYLGIGVGAYFISTSNSYDRTLEQSNNSFHFGVSPEAGISIPFIISNFGLNISTRYNFALKTSETITFSWFDFNVGLSFMY